MPTAPITSLSVRKILPCRPDVAFRAWTQPELFQQWFRPHSGMTVSAKFDFRVGGKYRITFNKPEGGAGAAAGDGCSANKPVVHVDGEFTVIDPPRRVEYTWMWAKETNPDWTSNTLVKVEFNRLEKDRTEIVLTHERFDSAEDVESHTQGWTTILECMAAAMGKS